MTRTTSRLVRGTPLRSTLATPFGGAGSALVLGFVLAACSQSSSPTENNAQAGQAAGGAATANGGAPTAGSAPVGGSGSSVGGASAAGGGNTGQGAVSGTTGQADGGAPAAAGGSSDTAGRANGGGGASAGGGGASAGGAANGGMAGAGPNNGSKLPGDIAAAAGTPLVAAHSMIRAMYGAYNGKLFQVRRSDGKTQDIGPVSAGGAVDLAALRSFCTSACTIAMLYDQAGNKNDLPQTSPTAQMVLQYYTAPGGTQVPMAVTISQQYLRNRTNTTKIPVGAAAQTEYFVVNTKFFNAKCCWDYGNMELVAKVSSNNKAGNMSALNIGTSDNGYANPGAGNGPWGMVDYEAGVYSGSYRIGQVNPNNPSLTWPIATVLTKSNGTTLWTLKVGDAAKGNLITAWNGALPPGGYNPLTQQGGLSLGEGGDGSKLGTGAFFEGVVIAAVTSDATDAAIQAGLTSTFE